jgi:hypothetical protein
MTHGSILLFHEKAKKFVTSCVRHGIKRGPAVTGPGLRTPKELAAAEPFTGLL